MYRRTPRALAAAAALALGACSDIPATAPDVLARTQPSRTVSGSAPTLIPNSVKYRDSGGKPATGRAGSAALQAFALLGKDGRTDLEFGAIPADPTQSSLTGTMARAQVRAMGADSATLFQLVLNHLDAETHAIQFGTLARGQYLQVQANVTGIDPNRTDVVTVTEQVKLRPDLTVHLEMAAQVPAAHPVPVNATVVELNGDVGARADCVLRVDGVEVDWVRGAWVDAGDAVACAFTHSFAAGAHDVQVVVNGVVPGDWDTANNESAVVRVQASASVPEEIAFNYSAYATARQWHSDYLQVGESYAPATGERGELRTEDRNSGNTETGGMGGWTLNRLAGEISIEASQTTGGRVLHAESWTASPEGCSARFATGTRFYLCIFPFGESGYTSFDYHRETGTVTYHSLFHNRFWDENTGQDTYYYHISSTFTYQVGETFGFGDDYRVRVRMSDGSAAFIADATIPLQSTRSADAGSGCSTYSEPWNGYTSTLCTTWDREENVRSGRVSN